MKVAATVVIRWWDEAEDVRGECNSVQYARKLIKEKATYMRRRGYEVVLRNDGVYEAWGQGGEREGFARVRKSQMWMEVME